MEGVGAAGRKPRGPERVPPIERSVPAHAAAKPARAAILRVRRRHGHARRVRIRHPTARMRTVMRRQSSPKPGNGDRLRSARLGVALRRAKVGYEPPRTPAPSECVAIETFTFYEHRAQKVQDDLPHARVSRCLLGRG